MLYQKLLVCNVRNRGMANSVLFLCAHHGSLTYMEASVIPLDCFGDSRDVGSDVAIFSYGGHDSHPFIDILLHLYSQQPLDSIYGHHPMIYNLVLPDVQTDDGSSATNQVIFVSTPSHLQPLISNLFLTLYITGQFVYELDQGVTPGAYMTTAKCRETGSCPT